MAPAGLAIVRMACKPDSVWKGLPSSMTIHLADTLPCRSGCQPGPRCPRQTCGSTACDPYSALLPVGLALPPPLPAVRWSLTPPFHPCLRPGGLFSVALSLGSPRPGVTRHRCLVESGLSSRHAARPSSHPHQADGSLPRVHRQQIVRMRGNELPRYASITAHAWPKPWRRPATPPPATPLSGNTAARLMATVQPGVGSRQAHVSGACLQLVTILAASISQHVGRCGPDSDSQILAHSKSGTMPDASTKARMHVPANSPPSLTRTVLSPAADPPRMSVCNVSPTMRIRSRAIPSS